MTEMAAAAAVGQERETIDQAIEQIESLYRSVTGQEAPPADEKRFATIPPEKSPELYVTEQVDRLIDALGNLAGSAVQSRSWTPPIAIWEGAGEIVIRVDLPGVSSQSTRVTAGNGVLEVSGKRMPRPADDGKPLGLRYLEPWQGEFRRSIPLPHDVDVKRLQAHMRDGVLELTVPRQNKPFETRSVPVA